MKSVDLALELALAAIGAIAKSIGEDGEAARKELEKRIEVTSKSPETLEDEIKKELP